MIQWGWQKKDWPTFSYDKNLLQELEDSFRKSTYVSYGERKHLSDENLSELMIKLLSSEAMHTSEIEGEILDRNSLIRSLQRELGILSTNPGTLREDGVAKIMYNLYKSFNSPLDKDLLFGWHSLLMANHSTIKNIGAYRTSNEPMQIISGSIYDPKVHFEAPPSKIIEKEMATLIKWFNTSKNLPIIVRSAIAHLWFVFIHPFEDGNGRIARSLSIKSISDSLDFPVLIPISEIINEKKKDYYDTLERQNKTNDVSEWLSYFGGILLAAQKRSADTVKFILKKETFFHKNSDRMNERQKKVIVRILKEGVKGFKGGLSSENYVTIAQTSASTATRDLKDLTDKGILFKTGELKGTRYWVNLTSESKIS